MPRRASQTRQTRERAFTRAALLVLVPGFLAGIAAAVVVFRPSPGGSPPAPTRLASQPRGDGGAPTTPSLALVNDQDMRRAEEALTTGRAREAIQLYGAARKRHPHRPEPLLGLAEALVVVGEFNRALGAARAAVELAPRNTVCHLSLGRILEAWGRKDEAETAYLEAAKLAPDNPEPFYRLGRIADGRRQSDVAAEHYRRALEADAAFTPAAHYLAFQLSNSGSYEEAERLLKGAIAREPRNPSLRFNLAHIYLKMGNPGNAAKEFRVGLSRDPHDPQAHYFLGRSLELLNRETEALDAYGEALRRDPSLHAAWYAVAQLRKRRGETAEADRALREFEKARALRDRILQLRGRLSKHPRDASALVELGAALLDRGRPAEAADSLKKALGLDPDNPHALELLRKAEAEIPESGGRR